LRYTSMKKWPVALSFLLKKMNELTRTSEVTKVFQGSTTSDSVALKSKLEAQGIVLNIAIVAIAIALLLVIVDLNQDRQLQGQMLEMNSNLSNRIDVSLEQLNSKIIDVSGEAEEVSNILIEHKAILDCIGKADYRNLKNCY